MINKCIYFILLCFIHSYAGSTYEYGYCARSFSLSSTLVADNYHSFNSLSNPALLNQSKGKIFSLSYYALSLDRSMQTFYYSQKLAGNAGLSIAILRTSSGEFIGTDSFNNPTNELSNKDYYGLLSFGVGSKNGTGIGLSMRLHYSNLYVNELHIDKYTGNSITLDLGGLININSKLRIGMKLSNFLNPYLTWDIDRGDGLSNSYQEEYPFIISYGAYFNIDEKSNLFFQYNSVKEKIYQSTAIGYEYISHDNLILRFGCTDDIDITFGFGYNFNIKQIPLILDYAVDLGSQGEGVSHLFTWSIGLND